MDGLRQGRVQDPFFYQIPEFLLDSVADPFLLNPGIFTGFGWRMKILFTRSRNLQDSVEDPFYQTPEFTRFGCGSYFLPDLENFKGFGCGPFLTRFREFCRIRLLFLLLPDPGILQDSVADSFIYQIFTRSRNIIGFCSGSLPTILKVE